MNKIKFGILLGVALLASVVSAHSQTRNRVGSGLDVGVGFKVDNVNPSVQYYQLLHLLPERRFSIGWTARLSPFFGHKLDFITAPAGLSRGKTGFDAIGAPYVPANLDTITFSNVSATALNFGIRVQGRFGPVEIGASADLLGLTIGGGQSGVYRSSTGKFVAGITAAGADSVVAFTGTNVNQLAHPTAGNLRLFGDNNIGTLGTEVFVRVFLNQRIAVKIGYQWVITEMTNSNRDIVANNDRFRYTTSMTYVGLTFPLN